MRQILLAIPITYKDIANSIAQVLDSDVGGNKTFDTVTATDSNGAIYAVSQAYCSMRLPDYVQGFLNSPASYMYLTATNEYARRFPDMIPPSLSDCETFISNVLVSVDTDWYSGLEALGLTHVIPAE